MTIPAHDETHTQQNVLHPLDPLTEEEINRTTHGSLPVCVSWPVMPVETVGFSLKPVGFFDGNPALDVPASEHCEQHAAE
jgi:Cu2+-containing amine oxidase